jgi:cysteine desulfurase
MKQPIYLDHAAATPLDDKVLMAMQPYLTDRYFNPSAQYGAARAVKKDIEDARVRVAHWFGARPSEIIFVAGGSEANNLAIHGVMQKYPHANLVVSAIEHDAVLESAGRYNHKLASVTPDGTIDLVALAGLIDDKTVLVSVMYANNEIGTIEPLQRLSQLLATIRHERHQKGNDLPLYLHTDACQAAAYLDLHVARLGVDMMTVNGGKIYGPKQSGALYVRAGLELEPLVYGGGQERGLRSGTENVAGIVGLSVALDMVQTGRAEEVRRLQQLQQLFIVLLTEKLPMTQVNGALKHRLPNNVHVTFPGQDNERLMILLEEAGILAAAGSACSASSEEPSHVLRAIGLSDKEAQASLRFTMGRVTDEAAVRHTVDVLAKIIA